MGLAMAHAYQLKEKFCNKTTKAEKLQSLLSTARKRKERRVGSSTKQRKKKTDLSVNLNIFEFNSVKNRFHQLKAPKGGGCRQMQLQRTFLVKEVLFHSESVFFPNGKSTTGLKLINYTSNLADCTQTVITSQDEDLTLDEYKEKHGFKDIRFSLLIKKRSRFAVLESQMSELAQDSDSDFEDLSIKLPPFPPPQSSSPLQRRRDVISQQNEDFQKSLETDRNKLKVAI